jgi:putative ABC transport system permease protein
MILKYVLKNFSRRKVRTILMVLSLMVSTGLIVTMSATLETVRRSNVDLIASEVGRFDLSVKKQDTSSDPFIFIAEVAPQVAAADPRITGVYPRIESPIEFNNSDDDSPTSLLALDPDTDDIGFIDVVSGTYKLGNRQAAILEDSAQTFGFKVGDTVDVSYSFPLPREEGQTAATGASERRTSERFTISAIVREDGVADGGMRHGLIVLF